MDNQTTEKTSPQTKLYEQAYEILIEQISSGTFELGDRLPSENELAIRFSMSRPTIRKALARLQADGIVLSRRGSGNFIQARPTSHIQELSPGSGNIANMIHSFELKITLEGESAALAAERRTDADIVYLEHILQTQAATIDKPLNETHNADLEFHNAVAQTCRNPLYEETIKNLNNSVMNSWLLWNRIASIEYKSIWIKVLDEHQKVFEAIRDGDASGARHAMQIHIQNGRERILKTSLLSSRPTPIATR